MFSAASCSEANFTIYGWPFARYFVVFLLYFLNDRIGRGEIVVSPLFCDKRSVRTTKTQDGK